MGLFNILDPILDFVLKPLLNLGYFWFLLIMSFIISLGLIVATKFLTNQKLMKELRDLMKKYQNEAKENKSNPQKLIELQKKSMQANLDYMKHSFKSTIYSLVPMIVLIGWMSANIAYLPLAPEEQFNVTINFGKKLNGEVTIEVPEHIYIISDIPNKTIPITAGKASWALKPRKEGNYELAFTTNSEIFTKKILVTKSAKYEPAIKRKKSIIDYIYGSREGYLDKDSPLSQIALNNNPVKPLGSISILGWRPGWLGVYFIFSLVFTMTLRKLIKVY